MQNMNDENRENLTAKGFKQVGIDWLGTQGKYYFDVQDKQDSETQLEVSFSLAPNTEKNKLFEYLDTMQKDQVISDYSMADSKVRATYNESTEREIGTFIKGLAEKLEEIDARCVCSSCSNTEDLAYYASETSHALLCEDCARKAMNDLEADKAGKGNYIQGFLASLAGAIIGSFFWIVIGALGFVASIAGFAIAWCAFTGYAFAKGKLTKKGIVLNVVAIVIAFIFAQYAGLFIDFLKEVESVKGHPILALRVFLLITPEMLSDGEFVKELLPNIGLGLLFAFLGTYRMIANNFKTAKAQENLKIEKIDL